MSVYRFLTYIMYSRQRPSDIHPSRWRAMLRQFELYGYDVSNRNVDVSGWSL